MRYVLAPITRPDQVADEIARFVQYAGVFVVKMVRATAKTGVKTSCLVEVPDSFAEKAERVLQILTGLVPQASTLDVRPRSEWTRTIHFQATATARALPFDDLLATIQSAVLEVTYTAKGATAIVHCTEADVTLIERLQTLGWMVSPKGLRSLVQMFGGLFHSTTPVPIALPLQQSQAALRSPQPITTAPPASAKQSAYLADGSTDGPKLILGSAKDGSAIALAWKSVVLQLQARDEQLRSALLTLASRGFGEGCSVLLMAPRLVIRDFEELLPNRFRLLDTRNLWESVCIPWQTMEHEALTHFLEPHGLFQGVTLPAELPIYFRDLLRHVGADALATEALLALTAPPGDDLLGICAAGGGLLFPYDDAAETGLIMELALQVLAPQNTTPFLIIRPPHIQVPHSIAAHAIQIVLGQEPQVHGVLEQADGWELRFMGEVDTHYLRSDLSAKPIDSADLAVQSRVISALQGDDFDYDADDELNTVMELPELGDEQLIQIIADPAPVPLAIEPETLAIPIAFGAQTMVPEERDEQAETLPVPVPFEAPEDSNTVAFVGQQQQAETSSDIAHVHPVVPLPEQAETMSGELAIPAVIEVPEASETLVIEKVNQQAETLPLPVVSGTQIMDTAEPVQHAETLPLELTTATVFELSEEPETFVIEEEEQHAQILPNLSQLSLTVAPQAQAETLAIPAQSDSQSVVRVELDQQAETPPFEQPIVVAEDPETMAFVEQHESVAALTIMGAEDHETRPFDLVIPAAFGTPETLEIVTTSMVSVVIPDEDNHMTEQEPLTASDLRSAFAQGVSFPQLVKLLQDEYPQVERGAIRSFLKQLLDGSNAPIPWGTEVVSSLQTSLDVTPAEPETVPHHVSYETFAPETTAIAEPQGVHDVFLDGRIWRQWEDGVSLAELIAEIAKSQGLGKERSQDLLYQIVVPQVVEKLQAQDLAQRLAEKKKPLKAQQEVYMQLLCEVARAKSLSATTEQRTHERVVKALHVVLG
jgi:hypothetical protein